MSLYLDCSDSTWWHLATSLPGVAGRDCGLTHFFLFSTPTLTADVVVIVVVTVVVVAEMTAAVGAVSAACPFFFKSRRSICRVNLVESGCLSLIAEVVVLEIHRVHT